MAVKDLARQGLLVEPASAVALAAFRSMRETGEVSTDRAKRFGAHGAGAKWPEAMSTIFPGRPLAACMRAQRIVRNGAGPTSEPTAADEARIRGVRAPAR